MKVVHCKKEPYDVYIGRPSRFGNPYSHIPGKGEYLVASREHAIEKYREMVNSMIALDRPAVISIFSEVAGKTLGCWCTPNACHGDVIIDICKELGLI